MAHPRFNTPQDNPHDANRGFNNGPKPLPKSRWLVERATGFIHPYSPDLAARSDLVDNYYGPLPWEQEPEVKPVTGPTSKPKAKAKPKVPAPPIVETPHPEDFTDSMFDNPLDAS